MVSDTQKIKNLAHEEGFDLVGIASVSDPKLTEASLRYQQWLSAGYQGSMQYLGNHTQIKNDPSMLLPNCQSVIVVGLLYLHPNKNQGYSEERPLSKYVSGQDYHLLMTDKLNGLSSKLKSVFQLDAFAFVDKHPVFERFWAWRAGLGWIGKNSMLINRKYGSYFFLGGLLSTLQLEADTPGVDHCGKCRLCIDACPTSAILESKKIDSTKCISYQTIENKSVIPVALGKKMKQWVYGCDICQNVCPWNDPLSYGKEFQWTNILFEKTLEELVLLTKEDFNNFIKNTAMSRIHYAAFLRNLVFGVYNSNYELNKKKALYRTIKGHLDALTDSKGKRGALLAFQELNLSLN